MSDATSSAVDEGAPTDFDFLIGSWRVTHRRLNERLTGCNTWTDFRGTATTVKILGGFGNFEEHTLELPGQLLRAAAIRSYDAAHGTWAIWWLSRSQPHQIDVPLVGGFAGDRGVFFSHDTHAGKPIKVRFTWLKHAGVNPAWEQAFSPDDGATWEPNWLMHFERLG